MGVVNSITELEEITEEVVPEGYPKGRRALIEGGKVKRLQKLGKADGAVRKNELDAADACGLICTHAPTEPERKFRGRAVNSS